LFVYICNVLIAGILGGKFLERAKVKKPDQPSSASEAPRYYSAWDLYIGATVDLNRHKFILVDADEYAYNFMEQHSREVRFAMKE